MIPKYSIRKDENGSVSTVLVEMSINNGLSVRRYIKYEEGYLSQALHERMDTCPQPRHFSEAELPEEVRNLFLGKTIENLPVFEKKEILV